MRIAIDARKLRDYGIGTYVRNLLRHLARLDDYTEYIVLCRDEDRAFAAELGENFRAVPERSGGYSVREQWALPLDLRRERADLFHAPHYVLPPLTPCRSVVTIHDCIHLRFPQYLPNRLGYAYARTSMWFATHRAARVLTVSEASKRDILEYFDVPESKITVIYNAIDERFSEEPPADEVMRVRERYQLNDPFILYAGNIKPHKNLERLIEAFHIIRKGELEFVKLLIIGDEISKYAALRRTVHRYKLHKHVRFFGFVPDATLAILYRLARVFVFPVALRGVRPAAARGDGERHAGDHLERLLAARSRRRRGDADRSLRDRRDRRRDAPRPDGRPAARRHARTRPGARARVLVGPFGPPRAGDLRRGAGGVSATAGRRVALVHDWLTGMRGGEKVLDAICEIFPDAPLTTLVRVPGSVSSRIEARPIRTSFVQALPARRGSTAITCRSIRSPCGCSTSRASTWSSAAATAP